MSRAFHNVNSHYNVYFNGNESLKAGKLRIENAVEDDFTRILPIFKDSDPTASRTAKSDMENVILKASKLIKLHSITAKPKRRKKRTRRYQEFASKEEFNNWIDDAYLLMGKGYFYQDNFITAIDNFSYITRKFPEETTRYEAEIWLVRSYIELERYIEATELIQSLQADENFPRKLEKDLAVVTADLYMKSNDYLEAIKFLDIAIQKTFWKKQKVRLKYILAQLYQQTGNSALASTTYKEVSKMNAPYKMAFNAKINAIGAFADGGDMEKLKKELRKMLKDKKNLEFKDQIYYALANIIFKEGNRDLAIDNYKESVSASITNSFQLAKSAITLGELFFEDLEYRNSQAYYDSAMIVIDETYPNFDGISIRYNSLTQLVENLFMVEREDSLQNLAQMDEADLNAFIDELISTEQEKLRQQESLAMQGRSGNSSFYRANENRLGLGQNQAGAGWYFYNPQTVSFGKVQFQQRWGRRKLEDDWRRSDKRSLSIDEFDEFDELLDSTNIVVRVEDPLKREFYTQDIPLTDSLMNASHERIMEALYNAGRIFKSEFNNYDRSAESFEELIERYPQSIYTLSTYFDLYDLYELMSNGEKSNLYRGRIINGFPDSKYAKYLLNPNFFIDLEAQKDSLNRLYQFTFNQYKAGKYPEVISLTGQMNELEPDSSIIPKIDFFRTIALGTQSEMVEFESLLKGYVEKYPKEETAVLAQDILSLIEDSTLADYQKLVEIGYLNDQIQNEELLPGNQNENDEFGGKFAYDDDLLHYFVIAYPRTSDVDINRLKFDIANYNIDHYTKIDFDIETENLDGKTALLIVRALSNKDNSLIYFRSIIRQKEVFNSLAGVDYINIVASSTNYRAILADKSLSDYLRYFVKNYSRFIGSDFDESDYLSPEEMMAKAKEEEEKLEERGTFVMVTADQNLGTFDNNIDTLQSFVLAVKDEKISVRQTLTQFAAFNRAEFRTWGLALQIKPVDGYQLIVIKGIPGFVEGMSYFRRVIMNRPLFENLGQISYRNFLATDENVLRLMENGKIDEYMDFFRGKYLQADPNRIAAPVTNTPNTQVAEPEQKPEELLKVPEEAEEISSPYNSEIKKPHYFVLVIPSEGIDTPAFIKGINEYNAASFAGTPMDISEQPMDDLRSIVRISGLPDDVSALQYFRQFVRNRSLFEPIGDANYRNFLISEENFDTFLQEKNITEYMDFYKRVYLGQ